MEHNIQPSRFQVSYYYNENKFNEIYLLHVESLLQSHFLKSNFLEIFENFHKIGRTSVSILVLMRL